MLAENPISYILKPFKITDGTSKNVDGSCMALHIKDDCKAFPVIDIAKARDKGKAVLFLEQAFEWDKISYLLYPYFHGDQSRWMDTYDHFDNDDQNDSQFVAFLRAGYVRVLVAVRPAYETAVQHFRDTREIWNGGNAPVIGDPLYISIHEEIRNQTDEYYGAKPEGEPWEYVLPTSLIYLQEDGNLPKFETEFPTNK
ncbi:MAG: hypothetical protein IPH04_18875 [Saprospirales bacterium]|nr:hypothetical protein [Saprospirales bacterium]